MNNKDVIYVDVEDEITNIIDKVNTSKSKVVALVLPKRATVFQSVVNMKLLKKKALEAKKNVILVTSEAGLLPLAGAVGVHVAKSLQAKPVIPPNPNAGIDEDDGPLSLEDDEEKPVDAEELNADDPELDKEKSIGELAGLAAVGAAGVAASSNKDDVDNIDFDNDPVTDPLGLSDVDESASKKSKKSKKAKGIDGKSSKVPDFNKFRRNLIIGIIGAAVLVFLYFLCFKILPKATIIVQTNTSNINTTISTTLSQTNNSLDPTNNTVPAKYQQTVKNAISPTTKTTGTKTVGTNATGTITISYPKGACSPFICQSDSVPAGTTFTDSSGNFSYVSNSVATIPSCHSNNNCQSVQVAVTATNPGANYNINSTSYTSSSSTTNGTPLSNYNLNGSAMSGGSSSQVQIVAQSDITSAQSQLAAPNNNQIEQELESSLQGQGLTPIKSTFVAGTPVITPSAPVGAVANSVTVSSAATYSMYGAKQGDLDTLVRNSVNQQINPATQSILNLGTSGSTFTQVSTTSNSALVTMQTTTVVGPKIDSATILTQSVGQKSADIKSTISQTPGVTNVTVKYSPFWVTSTPNNAKKITVIIEKSNGSQP